MALAVLHLLKHTFVPQAYQNLQLRLAAEGTASVNKFFILPGMSTRASRACLLSRTAAVCSRLHALPYVCSGAAPTVQPPRLSSLDLN